MIRRGVISFLVCVLVFDMATPLLPGAFRFNPDESIEVLRPHTTRVLAAAGDRLPIAQQRERLSAPPSSEPWTPRASAPRVLRKEVFPRRLCSPSEDCTPTTPEDH